MNFIEFHYSDDSIIVKSNPSSKGNMNIKSVVMTNYAKSISTKLSTTKLKVTRGAVEMIITMPEGFPTNNQLATLFNQSIREAFGLSTNEIEMKNSGIYDNQFKITNTSTSNYEIDFINITTQIMYHSGMLSQVVVVPGGFDTSNFIMKSRLGASHFNVRFNNSNSNMHIPILGEYGVGFQFFYPHNVVLDLQVMSITSVDATINFQAIGRRQKIEPLYLDDSILFYFM